MYKTLLSATLLMVVSSAGAQETTLRQCANIDDSLERLVCYDKVAQRQQDNAEPAPAQAAPKKAAKRSQQQTEQNAQQQFGMEHKAQAEGQTDKIEVEVVAREQGPYKKWRITLSNGQVWKQTGSASYFSWDDDDTYYIERGAFNSFFFGREGSNRRLRVKRVQ